MIADSNATTASPLTAPFHASNDRLPIQAKTTTAVVGDRDDGVTPVLFG